MLFISPYNDATVLDGYGTIAREVLADLPHFDFFVAPTGAGSIISGCAAILKNKLPNLKIIGVQSEHTATMYNLFYGKNLVEKESLAEGLAGGIEPDSITIKRTKKYGDQIILVSEKAIRKAIKWTLLNEHLLIEGSAAVVGSFIGAKTFSPGQNRSPGFKWREFGPGRTS